MNFEPRTGSKEAKQEVTLLVKEEVTPLAKVLEKIKPLLKSPNELSTASFQKDYYP